MKKFIFTRFGVCNFKESWFGWRMSVLESFTLQGIEQNDDNELYWVIFINRDAPLSEKRKLNSIIDQSCARRSIYLIDIDFMYEIKERSKQFVNEHTNEDERIILAQCDADDVYCQGFLKKIEELDAKKCYENETVLYTFPYGYRFLLMEKLIAPWVKECRSMNNFIITRDRNVTAFDSPHHLYKEYFFENNYKVISDDTLRYMWFKTESPDNVDTIYNDKKYFIASKKVLSSENLKSIYDVAIDFGLNNNRIENFYSKYPELPCTREAFIYRNSIIDIYKRSSKNLRELKEIFIEFSSSEFNRTHFHAYLKRVQKQKHCNALEALGEFYGISLQTDSKLLNIKSFSQYTAFLKENYKDTIVCLSVCDDSSKFYDGFFRNNSFGLKVNLTEKFRYSYAAILDFERDIIIEKHDKNQVAIQYKTSFDDNKSVNITVTSLGFYGKNSRGASCLISSMDNINKTQSRNDKEYCIGRRGLNVVIFSKSKRKVIDTFCVDFFADKTEKINRYF